MKDYFEDNKSSMEERIRRLQGKLKGSRNAFNRKSIIDELSKLEQERIKSGNLFAHAGTSNGPNADGGGAEAEDFPYLAALPERYPEIARRISTHERDVQAVLLYTQYFDDEFLGMLTERKLRLDVKFSIERDTFYNLFSNLTRHRDDYLVEADRVSSGEYAKSYEQDILKRLVEMRHNLFIETDRFFSRLGRFTHDLVDDIQGDGILCQNAEDELEYTSIDREKALRGRKVKQGVNMLAELCDEVVDYLDIPDFQR
ncbi:MAG: hypothetical protein GVY23_01585 [Spirochaetes bacterium]|jgi:hypothetical protein|nr:hypothetical protein [Spirochaetota bacterium]